MPRIAIFAVSILLAAAVGADPAPVDRTRLAIAVAGEPNPLEQRIRAELDSMGFDVEMVRIDEDTEPAQMLLKATTDSDASAAIRCEASAHRVEIWVVERAGGRMLNREIKIKGDSANSQSVVAFAASDLLRGSLIDLGILKKEEAPESVPGEGSHEIGVQAEIPAPNNDKRLFVGAGPALFVGDFGPSPGLDVMLDIFLSMNQFLGFNLMGYAPVLSAKVESDQGETLILAGIVGADARFTLRFGDGRWRANLATGFGLVLAKLSGRAQSDDLVGHEGFAYTPAPFLRAGVSFLAEEPWRIRLDGMIGWAIKEVEVRAVQETIAVLGRPFVGATLGVELGVW